METSDKFKNSLIHDKRAIIELLDELNPEQMVKVVNCIQDQITSKPPKNIKSVCAHKGCNRQSTCGDYCGAHCNCRA